MSGSIIGFSFGNKSNQKIHSIDTTFCMTHPSENAIPTYNTGFKTHLSRNSSKIRFQHIGLSLSQDAQFKISTLIFCIKYAAENMSFKPPAIWVLSHIHHETPRKAISGRVQHLKSPLWPRKGSWYQFLYCTTLFCIKHSGENAIPYLSEALHALWALSHIHYETSQRAISSISDSISQCVAFKISALTP